MITPDTTMLAPAPTAAKPTPNTKPQRRMARPGAVDSKAASEPASLTPASPAPAPTTPTPSPGVTKSGTVIALLRREQGATLAELIAATSWLPHTTRAALTGIRKKGHVIEKTKRGDTTCYRIAAAIA